MYTNADQFTATKKQELEEIIQRKEPSIIAVCEMKPKSGSARTVMDYHIKDYSLYSVNIENKTGRGIGVYVHLSIINHVSAVNFHQNFQEACMLEIRLKERNKLLFGCIYRSPTSNNTSEENNDNLNRLLTYIAQQKYSHICIVGDFNYKNINWSTYSTPCNEQSKEAKFLDAVKDSFLYQHVLEPTRARGKDDPSIIDLILTNEEMQISNLDYNAPLGKSDHSVLLFNYNCFIDYSKPREKFLYHKADYPSMRDHMESTQWSKNFTDTESRTIEDLWTTFKSKILELRDQYVPKTSNSCAWKKKGTLPIPKNVQQQIQKKKVAHRKWIYARRGIDEPKRRKEFKTARNKVSAMIRGIKKNIERKIATSAKTNPKAFWSHIRKTLKTKPGIAPLFNNLDGTGPLKFEDKQKADILQKQFSSVFTREPTGDVPQVPDRTAITISDCTVDRELVLQEINNLNMNKVCGPDEIHPQMLKELSEYLLDPLVVILNKSLSKGVLPTDWKKAFISPIYKKGNRRIAENYRPISLTSIVCKLLELIVKKEKNKTSV